MKIAIIEPHYDDCWLNVGGLILRNPQHEYRVITVSKDDNWGNNVNNTARLSKYIPHFESIEFRYDSLDVDMKKVKRQMEKTGAINLEDLFVKMNGLADVGEYIERTRKAVQGCDAVFLPLGIDHPMHIIVGRLAFDMPTLKYQEYPYSYYDEESGNLTDLTKSMRRFDYDISTVVDEKERIFREVYTTEIFVLDLPECPRRFSELNKEIFYSEDDKGETIWSALV